MTQSRKNNYPLIRMRVAVILIVFSLTFLPSKSVDDPKRGSGACCRERREIMEEIDNNNGKKKVLGSRPPSCVNKCLKCRPCKATLVIPPHHQTIITNNNVNGGNFRNNYYSSPHDHSKLKGEDDTYYLLSWKCTCGDQLFQP